MRLGIDLGGTKIEGVVIDAEGEVRARRRVPTPAGDGYEAVIRAIAELVAALEREVGPASSVGVGTPGSLSPTTGLMRNCNAVCLNERPLDRDLADALGRPIRLANDANCFTLSEATDGAAAGAKTVFGVILGTGTGGGIVVDGQVIAGANGLAGEWGHNPLPWPTADDEPAPPCFCGRRGCLETYVSGPGLRRDHGLATGEDLDPESIAQRAASGDAAAIATLTRHAERLARGLAAVINLLDPDVIVIGGGLSNIESLYTDVPRRWAGFVSAREISTRLVGAAHGAASGVRGAAWL